MNASEDLQFTDDLEWVRLEGEVAALGLSDHLVAGLGTIAAVELPQVGAALRRGDAAVVVRSHLSTHTVKSPFSGTVREVNSALAENPEPVAADPFQAGWLFKISLEAGEEVELLRDRETYERRIAGTDVGPVDSP